MAPQHWLLDTSAAVPLLLDSHPAHHEVSSWVAKRKIGLCGHALAETYSVLTRLPGDARLSSTDAVKLIDNRFSESVTLSQKAGGTAHRTLAAYGIHGGATWDGLVALAAKEHGAILVTRDARALATYDALGIETQILHTSMDRKNG